jgi:hypothetical protein
LPCSSVNIGDLHQQRAPCIHRRLAPGGEGCLRGSNGGIQLSRICTRALRDDLLSGGIDHGQRRGALDGLAADEHVYSLHHPPRMDNPFDLSR